ncbi:transglutaminase domain-containing protein [Polaribacter sp.]|uniref:transglutaminase domain-containing protein n=1 Tax=Polaribacter sp. TaxID=1920175 RepID=UPI003F6B4EEA
MKKWILLLFFNFLVSLSFTQEYKSIKKIVEKYPKFNSAEKIAERISLDFNSDYLKAKAAYYWLALNINYKENISNFIKSPEYTIYYNERDLKRRIKIQNDKLVLKTLKTKTAVCKGYTYSYKKICDLLNIKNETVKGYVKNTPNKIGEFAKYKNHIWNVIKIEENWQFIDVTFGSNRVFKNNKWVKSVNMVYFDIDAEKLGLTHYPEKQKWINLMKQKSLLEFCFEPIYYNEYFVSNVEIMSPKKGIIEPNPEAKKIILKFKNLKDLDINYSYGSSKNSLQPKVYLKDDKSAIVSIKKPSKNDLLNIFFNNKLAMQYKIILK